MSGNLSFRFAITTDAGLVRSNNEDSAYASSNLLVVADGMGGRDGGEVASAVVVTSLVQYNQTRENAPDKVDLAAAVANMRAVINSLGQRYPNLSKMGSTVTAIFCDHNELTFVHVGDTRAYLWQSNQMMQLSKDHTYVQRLVDTDQISQEQAKTHAKKHLLTRAIDGRGGDDPDIFTCTGQTDQKLLVCSDGLYEQVPESKIAEILTQNDISKICQDLVQEAIKGGGLDNITCIVAEVTENSGVVVPPCAVGAVVDVTRRDIIPDLMSSLDGALIPTIPISTESNIGYHKNKTKGVRYLLVGVSATLIMLLTLVLAFVSWSKEQYYIGDANGQVVIYQGVPYAFGPLQFYHVYQTSTITVAWLPKSYQDSLYYGVFLQNLSEAQNRLVEFEKASQRCDGTSLCPISYPRQRYSYQGEF